jgi:hypothetical protein
MKMMINKHFRSPFARVGILALTAVLATLACDLTVTPAATDTPTPAGAPPRWICYQK